MFYLAVTYVHDNGMSDIGTEKRKLESKQNNGAQGGITIGLDYSLTDTPGTLLVNTLGRGWLPTLDRRAMEPTMINMSAITVPVIKTNGPLTSLRSHLLPAQYSVRSVESFVAWHAQAKHVWPALLACTHEPCPKHESVELEQISSEAKHSASEPMGGREASGGRGD